MASPSALHVSSWYEATLTSPVLHQRLHVLLTQWMRASERGARREDRRLDRLDADTGRTSA